MRSFIFVFVLVIVSVIALLVLASPVSAQGLNEAEVFFQPDPCSQAARTPSNGGMVIYGTQPLFQKQTKRSWYGGNGSIRYTETNANSCPRKHTTEIHSNESAFFESE